MSSSPPRLMERGRESAGDGVERVSGWYASGGLLTRCDPSGRLSAPMTATCSVVRGLTVMSKGKSRPGTGLDECPVCDADLGSRQVYRHLEVAHGPEDFGLSESKQQEKLKP